MCVDDNTFIAASAQYDLAVTLLVSDQLKQYNYEGER